MARLLTPGEDSGLWGDILNEFLLTAHSTNGILKAGSVGYSQILDSAITNTKISPTANIDQSKIANLSTDLSNKAETTTTITGTNSISGGGDLSTNRTLSLVNDAAAPGNSKYYGTDGGGTKGYYDLPAGGAGEANTASNVNTAGVGVFKQKTGVDLEFKGINAGSNKVTITDDIANNEIDINVAEANFTGIPLATAVSGQLPIANGGTGANTQSGAANAILPTQTGQSGNFLTTNGSDVSWGSPPTTPGKSPFVFMSTGVLIVEPGINFLYNDTGSALTITAVRVTVAGAPTGSSIIIDININGTTIFTNQANRPTIAISGTTSGRLTNMDVTTFNNGSYLSVDIDQIGSTYAGNDLTVQIQAQG